MANENVVKILSHISCGLNPLHTDDSGNPVILIERDKAEVLDYLIKELNNLDLVNLLVSLSDKSLNNK